MIKKERTILFFLLLLIFVIRLYHLGVPPLEIEESWRQADTESMAWNFANYDLNPLYPNFNYDGPLPNIPALELQVTTFIIAILYKIFGHHYFLSRLVPITFFMISCLFLYLFARRHLSQRGALFSLLIYGILPVNVFYSRAIMPESAGLMFWIAGIYYFDLWLKESFPLKESLSIKHCKMRLLVLSALFFSLALMTKPPVVFGAIVMLYLCFHYYGWKWLRFPVLWAYAAITLGLPFAWYYYSSQIAEFKFTLGITQSIILPKALSAFYSPETWLFFANSIPKTFGIIGFMMIIAGLFLLRKKHMVVLVWFLAVLLEVMLIVAPVRAPYYLIFMTVPCALVVGNMLDHYFSSNRLKAVAVVLILGLMLESYSHVAPMYRINEVMAIQTRVVQKLTLPDDLLVAGSYDPCILSLSDRRGWRFNIDIYNSIPDDPYRELDLYIEKGAKYFVPIQGKIHGDTDDRIMSYLRSRYPVIEVTEGYPIFVLQ